MEGVVGEEGLSGGYYLSGGRWEGWGWGCGDDLYYGKMMVFCASKQVIMLTKIDGIVL